jgi:hypothetical protein
MESIYSILFYGATIADKETKIANLSWVNGWYL